jgi:hypothetical protein
VGVGVEHKLVVLVDLVDLEEVEQVDLMLLVLLEHQTLVVAEAVMGVHQLLVVLVVQV